MRKLKGKDIFPFLRLLNCTTSSDNVKAIFEKKDEKTQQELGIEFLLSLLNNLSTKKAEDNFYDFITGVFEMKREEIEDLDFEELMNMFKQLAKENNLANFIQLATSTSAT